MPKALLVGLVSLLLALSQPGECQTLRLPFPISLPGLGGWSISIPGMESESPAPSRPSPAQTFPGQPLPDYEVVQFGGRPASVQSLPMRIYSTDGRFDGVTARAMEVWNDGGRSLFGRPFFERVTVPQAAQIAIDFTGQGCPADAVGATEMRYSSENIRIQALSIRGFQSSNPNWQTEVLAHELGHVLGLNHSHQLSDLMYARKRAEARGGEVTLSPRDLQMLGWLYSQSNTLPVVAGNF